MSKEMEKAKSDFEKEMAEEKALIDFRRKITCNLDENQAKEIAGSLQESMHSGKITLVMKTNVMTIEEIFSILDETEGVFFESQYTSADIVIKVAKQKFEEAFNDR